MIKNKSSNRWKEEKKSTERTSIRTFLSSRRSFLAVKWFHSRPRYRLQCVYNEGLMSWCARYSSCLVTRRKGGLLSVVGGAWTRALRLTSPRNVRTIRVLTMLETLALYTVQHVAGSNVYMVIGQTHVYRVQVQRMIACYLLTSGCRIEISQIVTIQSVNARNQVNYAPPRLNGLYLGASRPFSLVLKRTNCSLLRLKVDRPIIQWVIIKFEKFFWWRYVTREWFCLLLIERNLNRLLI